MLSREMEDMKKTRIKLLEIKATVFELKNSLTYMKNL